jgi:hypothetical protein
MKKEFGVDPHNQLNFTPESIRGHYRILKKRLQEQEEHEQQGPQLGNKPQISVVGKNRMANNASKTEQRPWTESEVCGFVFIDTDI